MKLIDISKIQIPSTRQRREFDPAALNELGDSIVQHGLFHPVVLRAEGETRFLVSGERRLRAIQDIWLLGGKFSHDGRDLAGPFVPWVDLGELSPLAAEEAELEENIRRRDLTWQESAEATARLHRLRSAQAQVTATPHTIADTAKEVRGSAEGWYQTETRDEIIVARNLDDPEVRAAKTLPEAMKVLRRKESAQRNVELAERVGRTFSDASHTALNCDSLRWMHDAADALFDVILTDPPYGMGADEFGDSGGAGGVKGAHAYADTEENFATILAEVPAAFFRLAKEQAHLYWFCDLDKFHQCRAAFQAAGWWVFRTPLIFHKPNAPRAPWPDHGPQRQYDLILYAVKGKKPVNSLRSDVLIYRPDAQLDHSAQKPVALYLDLLSRSTRPGDSVFDPFMGTGTIFPAAHEMKCMATGIEQDKMPYGTALKRLELIRAQGELKL